jgi:hypothetical protein
MMTARNRVSSRAAAIAYEVIMTVVEELVNKNVWLGRFVGDVPSSAESISIFANPE